MAKRKLGIAQTTTHKAKKRKTAFGMSESDRSA